MRLPIIRRFKKKNKLTLTMKKRGEWFLDEMGKLIIAIAIITFVVAFVILAKDKIITSVTNFFSGGFP